MRHSCPWVQFCSLAGLYFFRVAERAFHAYSIFGSKSNKMTSILGLRARTPEPSPLEGSGAFRALQIETEFRQLARNEWWLWFSACTVTLLAISALVLSFLPFLFRHTNHFYEIRSDQAQWGTAALLAVFNSWLVYRQ